MTKRGGGEASTSGRGRGRLPSRNSISSSYLTTLTKGLDGDAGPSIAMACEICCCIIAGVEARGPARRMGIAGAAPGAGEGAGEGVGDGVGEAATTVGVAGVGAGVGA